MSVIAYNGNFISLSIPCLRICEVRGKKRSNVRRIRTFKALSLLQRVKPTEILKDKTFSKHTLQLKLLFVVLPKQFLKPIMCTPYYLLHFYCCVTGKRNCQTPVKHCYSFRQLHGCLAEMPMKSSYSGIQSGEETIF